MLAVARIGTSQILPGVLVLLWAGLHASGIRADEPAPTDGLFLTVPNPITSEVTSRLIEKTRRALERPDRKITCVVYDFNPDGKPTGSSQYGPCRDLAKFLLEQHQVLTIAFVHNEVSRHTVLPVLACKELVMSADARIGDVLREQPGLPDEDVKLFYQRAVRNEGRWAIVWKMLNHNLEVLEGRKTDDGSVWYVARGHEPDRGVFVNPGARPVLPAGAPGLLSAAEAQKFGLCRRILATRQDVREAYGLPTASLREDPLEGRTPVPWRIEMTGEVNRSLKESLQRRIRKAIGKGANLLILEFRDCGGGDTQVAAEIADFLRTLKDDKGQFPIMTVAYVPQKAPDTATFLALGCSEIVMAKDAQLGDFQSIVTERPGRPPGGGRPAPNAQPVPVDEGKYRLMRDSLVGLAQEQGYSPLLARGMLDRKLTILQVQSVPGLPPEQRLISQQEWDEDHQPGRNPRWGNPRQIKPEGQFLVLSGQQARDLGVARHLAASPAELYAIYGLQPEQVRTAGPDWLDDLAAFLRQGWMEALLIMVGILCLVLELKLPGFGLPGVTSALCFVLFFWAHSRLAGQITWLAVLLFVLGWVLLGIEIFVLPGFGVCGISGIVLVIGSLGLVTLEKKPETTQEWLDFANTLVTIGFCIMAAVIGAFLVGKYLPHIPGANRLVAAPPAEDVTGPGEPGLQDERAQALLGAIGIAATSLRPAGMARFGDDFLDVVADGAYVTAGARVQVIEIEGNRIVVKEV